MKKSELTFEQGYTSGRSNNSNPQKAFDWNRAALKIKDLLIEYPNLTAEAGLQGDWSFTGGIIFENGFPTNENYTYLSSNWATPTLIIEVDGVEIQEISCFSIGSRYSEDSKWDEESLQLLGIGIRP